MNLNIIKNKFQLKDDYFLFILIFFVNLFIYFNHVKLFYLINDFEIWVIPLD